MGALGATLDLAPGIYHLADCANGAAQPATWNTAAQAAGGFAWLTGGVGINAISVGPVSSRLTAALTFVAATPFFPATMPALTLSTGSPGNPFLCLVLE